MNKVFLIGNGFDLNLGLRTSYNDFIKSDFFLKNVNNGYHLFDYLNEISESSGWIDIEKELSNYSDQFMDSKSFLAGYKKLCDELMKYIESIENEDIDKFSEAYKLFKNNDLGNNFTVLNFNYTNSVLNILTGLGYSEEILKSNIINVHGNAKKGNIIFGVGDKSRIDKNDSFLYKSTNSIFDGRECIEALNKFDELYVFGHSLGESDHMYLGFFNELSKRKYDKKINIFYHGEESKYSIFKELQTLTYHDVAKLKSNNFIKDFNTLEPDFMS